MRRISIAVGSRATIDFDELRQEARLADEAGVDSVWLGESWGADLFTLMAVVAEATERVRIGSAIVNVFSRTPAALAQHFATLDLLSEGRILIGLGTSGPQVIEDFHGLPYRRALRRLREYVEIMDLLIAGEPLNYEGELFQLQRGFTFRGLVPPRKHIPIVIGAMSPASVRQTARIADGLLPGRTPRSQWAEEVRAFLAMAAEAGRDPASMEVRAPGGAHVTSDPDAAYEAMRRNTAFYMARMGDLHFQNFARNGMEEEEEALAVRRAWDAGGSAAGYAALPLECVQEMGYAGPVEGCIEWLEAERDAGYTILPVAVDERDPKKRRAIYAQLVG
ncbi:MAG: LLM class flavin-dependent oxidoreductase [Dehalococcoidia bacterium]|nr:LLM class flavin-dependent oxidoreductase [Dehalococcoidia bacterium]